MSLNVLYYIIDCACQLSMHFDFDFVFTSFFHTIQQFPIAIAPTGVIAVLVAVCRIFQIAFCFCQFSVCNALTALYLMKIAPPFRNTDFDSVHASDCKGKGASRYI